MQGGDGVGGGKGLFFKVLLEDPLASDVLCREGVEMQIRGPPQFLIQQV